MPRENEAYRLEILQAIHDINVFISGMIFEEYTKDEKTKAAVERKLVLIGEALNQMQRMQPEMRDAVTDLSRIVAFRNILVHVYFGVDDQIVWKTVTQNLKQLQVEVENLPT